MKARTVDFLRPQPAPRWGWGLLAIGIICVSTSLWLVQQWRTEGRAAEQLRVQRDAAARKASKPIRVAPPSAQELRLRQAELEIASPWLHALKAIEASTSDPVYLTSLITGSASGSIAVEGEAPSLNDVLGFVRRVNDSQALSSAVLTSHELTSDALTGRQLVRFKLTALWSTK